MSRSRRKQRDRNAPRARCTCWHCKPASEKLAVKRQRLIAVADEAVFFDGLERGEVRE